MHRECGKRWLVRECEHIPGDVRAILWRCFHAMPGDLGVLRAEIFDMITPYGVENRSKPCSNDVVGCKRWRGHEGPCLGE